jgi:iron complex outermembrane receptor protein
VALSQDWRLQAHLTGLHMTAQNPELLLYPAGAWGGAFPQGMYGSPNTWERQWRGTVMAHYRGWTDHLLSIGIGHEDLHLYRTREYKNFVLSLGAPPSPLGDGSVVQVPVEDSFLKPHRRKVDHLILQDEWSLARDWTLTTGVRHDRYSDVGATTNPRVALVWDTSLDLTTKLLHGRAFRAPAFMELYSINNPVLRGNPELKPETIQTTELAFSWQARSDTLLQLSLFRYGMRDIIAPTGNPQVFQNTGKQNGRGFELEARHDITAAVSLTGNYAHQHSVDDASGRDAGYAPKHHLYGRADWRWKSGWQWSSQVNHVAGRSRPPGDTRKPVRDQSTLDLTVRSPRTASGWEVRASVRNVLDAKLEEPSLYSPGDAIPVLVPGDLPMAGRSLFVQVSLQM